MTRDPAQNPYTVNQVERENVVGGERTTQAVRTGQIITFALVQGVVLITAIMTWMVISGAEDGDPIFSITDDSKIMLTVGFVVAVTAMAASYLLNFLSRSSAKAQFGGSGQVWNPREENGGPMPAELQPLVGRFQTRTLIGQAVLEGAAVFNAVLMGVNENLLHLAFIIVLGIGIALQFPTMGKLVRWIEDAQMS